MTSTSPEITSSSESQPHDKEGGRGWLNLAGACFAIADMALFAYGAFSQKPDAAIKDAALPPGPDHGRKFKLAGLAGLSAGFVGFVWGNPKPERQLKQLERELGDHLRAEGIEIPADMDRTALTKESNLLDKANTFLHKHPAEIMTALQAMIGVQFLRIGLADKGPLYKRPMVYSGGLLMGGALSGLLIKEKQPDPENPPKGIFAKAKSYLQEKPLRGPSLLYNANQLFFGKDTWDTWRRNPGDKSIIFRLVAIAGFLIGNTSLGLSYKSEKSGEGLDKSTQDKLEETATRVILAQPEEKQNQALESIANNLAAQPKIRMSAEQISQSLHGKLREFAARQPTQHNNWQEQVALTSSAQAEVAP